MFFSIHLVDPEGKPLTRFPDTDIPHNIISQIHDLRYGDERMSLADAVTFVRSKLVPAGYSPYPFRRDTPESLLDKLHAIVGCPQVLSPCCLWHLLLPLSRCLVVNILGSLSISRQI